jgi:hypothetical protein
LIEDQVAFQIAEQDREDAEIGAAEIEGRDAAAEIGEGQEGSRRRIERRKAIDQGAGQQLWGCPGFVDRLIGVTP